MIKELGLSISQYLILYSKYYSKDWVIELQPTKKTYKKLISLGYLTKTRSLSAQGKKLFTNQLESGSGNKNLIKDEFNNFWEIYPRHDGILGYPRSTRVIRGSKDLAYNAYLKAVTKRNINPNDLLTALKNEIAGRTEGSKHSGRNEMTYMKGATRWLKEDEYLNWLDAPIVQEVSDYGKEVE